MEVDRTLATSKTGMRFPGAVLIVLALMAGSHVIPVPSPSPFDEWARGRRP